MFEPHNGKRGCDYSQTKLATYWSTPFESICVRMRCRNSWIIQSLKIDIKGMYYILTGFNHHYRPADGNVHYYHG